MANNKLTLSVEPDLVTKAKEYAVKHHTSLSRVVSNLLNQAIEEDQAKENDPFFEKLKKIEISDKIKALTGVIKGDFPDQIDLWEVKYEYLKDKYEL